MRETRRIEYCYQHCARFFHGAEMPSHVTPSDVAHAPAARRNRSSLSPQGSRVVIIAATAWIVLVSGVAYVVEKHMPSRTDTGLSAPAPGTSTGVTPVSEPALAVRFANPFDAAEVFEFPPGTSEMQAREAVARFLLERARNRLGQGESSQATLPAESAVVAIEPVVAANEM